MWFIKAVFIFFLGLFAIKRIFDIGDTGEKRDLKTEILYIIEVILTMAGVVLLFRI